jgi:serine protease inhibitor
VSHETQTESDPISVTKCDERLNNFSKLVLMDVNRLSRALNRLAFDLYQKIATKTPKNILFSPFAISNLLNMCFFCAKGEEQNQIAHLMHYELKKLHTLKMSTAQLKQSFITLLNNLKIVSQKISSL